MPEAVCQDCGAALVGQYCHACGLRAVEGRLGFADVGRWVLAKLLDTDRGLLLTVREMTLRPGATIRRYLAGQRGRLTNPFAYLFIGAALSFLVWSLLAHGLDQKLGQEAADAVRAFGPITDDQARRAAELQLKLMPYLAHLQLAMCLPLVLLLRLFFRRVGYNLAEICVFALFASGQVYMVDVVLTAGLVALRASMKVHTNATLLLYAVVFSHAAAGFFGGGRFRTTAKMLVALVLAMGIFGVAQSLLIRWYILRTP